LQPATTQAPTATLQDFQQLGILSSDELAQLQGMNLSPTEMGSLFGEAIAFMQTPEFAQMQQVQELPQSQAVQPQGQSVPMPQVQPEPIATDPAAAPAGGSADPAWSSEWSEKFQSALKEQGIGSQTRMAVIAQLKSLPLGEADLQQAFEYYTAAPEGIAELKQSDEQMRGQKSSQNKMFLGAGALALLGVGGTSALAASHGNLESALAHAASSAKDPAARVNAARVLETVKSGTKLAPGSAAANEARALLVNEARSTSRLAHPIQKLKLNAAGRHLTQSVKLPKADVLKYGLWMKTGDAAVDAAEGAATATKAVSGAAKAATAAGGAEKVVAGATQAVKGAGMLSKASKVLGPAGLVLGAGVGIWGIKQTMKAEGGFGEESAKMTGNVTGGLAGGIAGAAAGAAIGSVVPVIGTGIGAVVGGLIGGFGGGSVGESIGGFVHGLFD
jgi:phage tail tape-measure protein